MLKPNNLTSKAHSGLRQYALPLALALGLSLLVGCATTTGGRAEQNTKSEQDEAQLSQWQKAIKRLKRKRYDQALTLLDDIIKAQPQNAAAHVNRGIALAGLHRGEEAIAALEQGIRLRPSATTVAAAYNQAGMLYRERKQLDAARSSYQKAIKADPSFDLAEFNLGLLYQHGYKTPKKALPHYQRYQALQETPDPAVAAWIKMIAIDLQAYGEQ